MTTAITAITDTKPNLPTCQPANQAKKHRRLEITTLKHRQASTLFPTYGLFQNSPAHKWFAL
jgi:hypothetical protein